MATLTLRDTVMVPVCDTAMPLPSCILKTPLKVPNGEIPSLVVLTSWVPAAPSDGDLALSRSLLWQCCSPEPVTRLETAPEKVFY